MNTKSNVVLIGIKKEQLNDLHTQIKALKAEIFKLECEDCPTKVGDLIQGKDDGKVYRVIGYKEPSFSWVWGNPRKADGTFSAIKRIVYKYVVLERAAEAQVQP